MSNLENESDLPPEVSSLLYRLLPIVLLNTISIGIMWPALPEILLNDFNQDPVLVASFLAKISAVNGVLDFCTNPILGSMSDKYGRRVFLLQSLAVAAICDYIVAFNGSATAIILTKVLFGALDCTKAMCYNILVDTMDASGTDQKGRVKAFGLVGMAVGVGFALGPLLGGILTMKSPYLTTSIAGVLMTFSLLFATIKIDETLDTTKSRERKVCSVEKLGVVINHRVLSFLLPFLVMGIAMGPYSIWFIYSSSRFDWNGWKNGVFWFGHGCGQAIAGGLILPALSPALLSERSVVFLGICANALVFFVYVAVTANTSWLIYGIFPIIVMGYLSEPLLRLVFSQLVAPKDQGVLQGALASISTLSNAVGPLIAAYLFAWGSSYKDDDSSSQTDFHSCHRFWIGVCFNYSSTPFMLSSILFLLSIGFMRYAFHIKDRTDELVGYQNIGDDTNDVWGGFTEKTQVGHGETSLFVESRHSEFDDFTIEI